MVHRYGWYAYDKVYKVKWSNSDHDSKQRKCSSVTRNVYAIERVLLLSSVLNINCNLSRVVWYWQKILLYTVSGGARFSWTGTRLIRLAWLIRITLFTYPPDIKHVFAPGDCYSIVSICLGVLRSEVTSFCVNGLRRRVIRQHCSSWTLNFAESQLA